MSAKFAWAASATECSACKKFFAKKISRPLKPRDFFLLNKAVTFQLSIKRVNCRREAENYSDEPTFSAELKIIVDEPAQVQANKNNGGDINPNA